MPGVARLRNVSALAAALILGCLAIPAYAQIQFDLPSQSLAQALTSVGNLANINVYFDPTLIDGHQAPPLKAKLNADEALSRLLAGTHLHAVRVDENTVRVIADVDDTKRAQSQHPAPIGAVTHPAAGVHLASAGPDSGTSGGTAASDAYDLSHAGTPKEIAEVLVTAQKREERLIDTPQSVSVLSADDIARLGATQLRDFASTIPGLTYTTAGAGFTQISLRGVTTGSDVGSTVGIYIDEVPYGSSSSFVQGGHHALDVGLFDLDRIEVLRGPQGTLYGASTMGGLLKYVSKKPDALHSDVELRSGVSDTEDGGVNYNGSLTANIPLIEGKAALRASGFYSRDGGYIDNVGLNEQDVNRSRVYGGRLDFLATPIENLSIRVDAFLQDILRNGEATADYALAAVPTLGAPGQPVYGSLAQKREFPEPFEQTFRLVSATLNWDLGPAAITSVSSYQTTHTHQFIDVSAGYVPLLGFIGLPFFTAVGTPLDLATNKFTQEVRLSSTGKTTFEWVVGGFYTHETSTNASTFSLRDLAGQPTANILGTAYEPSRYEEYAGFGDLTYHVTSSFDMTGGIRVAHNSQSFSQAGTGLGLVSPLRGSGETVRTWLGNARYHFTEDTVGYLRYATGYRPGGPNFAVDDPVTGRPVGPSTFQADRLKSYEAGIKTQWMDRKFSLDMAGYYIDWSNIQILVSSGGFSGLSNAPGGAGVRGAELGFTARPITGLLITLAGAYQDAYLKQADTSLGAQSGERLPNVPKYSGSLSADYRLPWGDFQPSLGASVQYLSDRTASFNASSSPQYRLPAYATLDLRSGCVFTLSGDHPVDFQLYVHNVLDKRGEISASTLYSLGFGPAEVAIIQPRTVGISVVAHL
jgi:iron complex outermembrane recepter protein